MIKTITPCLWFDKEASEAAAFYCRIFKDARMLQQNPIVSNFEIKGTRFMALNGGPTYAVNSAISYFVYCDDEAEMGQLYKDLTEGGKILMALDKYAWSERYAWIEDAYGVNWQLDITPIASSQKIVPAMLFANQKMALIDEALEHYASIFKDCEVVMTAPYQPTESIPDGTLLFAQFKLNGSLFNAMSSSVKHDFDFTPGNSFLINCENQEEIDFLWEKLGEDGHYSMCGWLEDKFGISWQIVPAILSELMSDPVKSPRVVQAFMKMQKFDIAALLDA